MATKYEITARGVAVTALNILDGMDHRERWDALQAAWEVAGMGFIEFTVWIADIASHSENELAKQKPQDFCGVYDYEVSCSVGEDIALFMINNKKLPDEREWKAMFAERFTDFFERRKE